MIQTVITRQVTAVVAQHLITELTTVLARPKFRRWISLNDGLASVDALSREADLHPAPEAIPPRVRDPDGGYLVALAEDARAVIVSGDPDLLEAEITPPVITPPELLDRLGRT